MSNWIDKLNEEQKKAVTHLDGPLFVAAGAGTGKTRTLTCRIAYLIETIGIRPNSILAVTFTNKAAREMKERIIDMVGPHAFGVWIFTFHGFGLKVLRSFIEALKLGYTRDFNVLDVEDTKGIIKEAIKELNLDLKTFSIKDLSKHICNRKSNPKYAFESEEEELVFKKYQELLIRNNACDFDDLLIYTHKLFKENKDALNHYKEKFEHILIDEFQDTDRIQYEIIRMLVNKDNNLFLVGDPDQSIYSFRGADYANTQKYLDEFGNMCVLSTNYRSGGKILEKANLLIDNNVNRPIGKKLIGDKSAGNDVMYFENINDLHEVNNIAKEILSLINDGYKYEDIAILYRNNALSRGFEDTFIQMNIPYVIYGGLSFYERKEIKDILAYIRIVVNPNLDFYLKRIINVPKRQIGNTTVEKLEDFARNNGLSMFEALDKVRINSKLHEKFEGFKDLILEFRKELEEPDSMKKIISSVANKTGYFKMLDDEKDDSALERIANIKELQTVFSLANNTYEGNSIDKLRSLLEQIALYTDLEKKSANDNVVKLSTIHQVKGLEFKVVFLVCMEEGIFPSERSMFSTFDLEEERRVCYVGVTRAKDKLYISRSGSRMLYGQVKQLPVSRFVNEMDLVGITRKTYTKEFINDASRVTGYKKVNNQLSAGDKVNHVVFGEGMVVSVEVGVCTIAFKLPHGIKKLMADHPSINKI